MKIPHDFKYLLEDRKDMRFEAAFWKAFDLLGHVVIAASMLFAFWVFVVIACGVGP